jgi:hypothetical protein
MRYNPEYEKGYFKACLDIKNFFERNTTFMKSLKMFNAKGVNAMLGYILKNNDDLMMYGDLLKLYVGKNDKGEFIFQRSE